jgi:hypothetical protein
VYAVPAADLVASQYLYDHAPGGSYLVLAAPNFPVRIAGTYDRVLGEFPDADYAALTANSAFQTDQSTEQDVERISQYTYSRTNHGKNSAYLVLGPSEDAYLAEYDGTTSAMAKLDNALGKSPKWRVFYRNGGTVIYQVLSA